MFGKKYAGHNDFKIALTRQLVFLSDLNFLRFCFLLAILYPNFASYYCGKLLPLICQPQSIVFSPKWNFLWFIVAETEAGTVDMLHRASRLPATGGAQ